MTSAAPDAVAHIRAEAQRFADVLGHADPSARVPTCPDWDATDLAWHLTDVHLFWSLVLQRQALTSDDLDGVEAAKPARPAGLAAILSVRAEATRALLGELSSRHAADPAWTWFPQDQSVGFVRRMQTHEATIHRHDAELTAGLPVSPVPDWVADDGIDHAVDVMISPPTWASVEAPRSVELVASDTGKRVVLGLGRWRGTGPESGTEFDEPAAVRADEATPTPTATVTAPATELYRWLWGRPAEVERSGDSATLEALDAVVAVGID